MGHNHFFDEVAIQAREDVDSGAVGRPLLVETFYSFPLSPRYTVSDSSHWAFELPGGLFQNVLVHPLCNALHFLKGEVQVRAFAYPTGAGPRDDVADQLCVLAFDGSLAAHITLSVASNPLKHYLRVTGDKGTVEADLLNWRLQTQRLRPGLPSGLAKIENSLRTGLGLTAGTVRSMADFATGRTWYDGVTEVVQRTYRAVESGGEPPVPMDEARRLVAVCDRVWEQIGSQAG